MGVRGPRGPKGAKGDPGEAGGALIGSHIPEAAVTALLIDEIEPLEISRFHRVSLHAIALSTLNLSLYINGELATGSMGSISGADGSVVYDGYLSITQAGGYTAIRLVLTGGQTSSANHMLRYEAEGDFNLESLEFRSSVSEGLVVGSFLRLTA